MDGSKCASCGEDISAEGTAMPCDICNAEVCEACNTITDADENRCPACCQKAEEEEE